MDYSPIKKDKMTFELESLRAQVNTLTIECEKLREEKQSSNNRSFHK